MTGTPAATWLSVGAGSQVEEFCRTAYPRLCRTLSATTGDPMLAHEVTQEALARAWQRWDRVSKLDSPEAWCFRVALNLATSQFRRRAAEQRAHARMRALPQEIVPPDEADDELQRALAKLPDSQRVVLALRFLADLSVDDSAVAMRVAPGTVKSMTSRALAALRVLLEEDQR